MKAVLCVIITLLIIAGAVIVVVKEVSREPIDKEVRAKPLKEMTAEEQLESITREIQDEVDKNQPLPPTGDTPSDWGRPYTVF